MNDGHTNKADDVRVITIMIAGLFLVHFEKLDFFKNAKTQFFGYLRNFDSRTILLPHFLRNVDVFFP